MTLSLLLLGMVRISENEVGIIFRKFGRRRPVKRLIALHGEEGWQASSLRPGLHWGYFPWIYKIRKESALHIGVDEIGLVEAKDGVSPQPGRMFGKIVVCDDFQDGPTFLTHGGERGKQAAILTTGTYGINPELFSVERRAVVRIHADEVGLVEAQDGAPLPPGRNFGQVVACNHFQDAQAFFEQGGERGKQLAILPPGPYQINTDLFQVQKHPLVHISADEVGLVEAQDGAPLLPDRNFGQVVACNHFQDAQAFFANGGQKGPQCAILRVGVYRINTELFKIQKVPVVQVEPGEIALVMANDGLSLPSTQMLGKTVACNNFQDAQAFFANGGQKGKQLAILPAGRYHINTALFTVITAANATQHHIPSEDLKVYTVETNKIGIVTTLDGTPPPLGEIAGPVIEGHNKFQDGQKFLDTGGCKGLQEEVLLEGSWHLNPWFVRVAQEAVTHIEPGTVGVVISHVGKSVIDEGISPREALQFRLVDRGYKGVEKLPLPPNKYPINTRTQSVLIVPAHEISLHWSNGPKSALNYDADLRELELRDKDEFIIKIEVTQVLSIPPHNAPMMISRIGSRLAEEKSGSKAMEELRLDDRNAFDPKKYPSINTLVTRILQPTVESYFRNAAQDYEAQDFREKRGEIRLEAIDYITPALDAYGVQAINTLIRKIDLPDSLEKPKQRQKTLMLERQTQREAQALEEERLQGELATAQARANIAHVDAQTKLEKAKADAETQRLMDIVTTEKQRSIQEIDNNALGERVRMLGAGGYIQLETAKANAGALRDTRLKLPERVTIISPSGSSGEGGALQASARPIASMVEWIETWGIMKPPRSKLRGITRKGIICETPRFLTLFPLQGNPGASSEESPD